MMSGNSFIFNFNMKDFIKYITIVTVAAFCTYYALVVCAICYMQMGDLSAPAGVSIAVFGNSIGECAVNDNILSDSRNYCASGLNYDMEEEYIKAVLKQNPQIKTAVLCFDVYQYASYPNRDIRHHSSSQYAFFGGFIAFDGSRIFTKYPLKELIKFTIGSNLLIASLKTQYGYRRLVRNTLPKLTPCQMLKDIPYAKAKDESSYNLDALPRIIHFCRQKGVDVVLMATPMYHLDMWYGKSGYYEYLDTLDESVQIADYSNFLMPSDDCYGDVIHLNYKGAKIFSTYLKEHGLQAVPIKEYLKYRR